MGTSVLTFFCLQSKAFRRFVASIIFFTALGTHVFAGTAVQIIPSAGNSYSLDFPVGTYTCQSIAHLNIPDVKKNLFSDATINQRIKAIGSNTINAIIKHVLNREEELFPQNYAVFYHAQKLEFILLQDLIAMLVKILHKKQSDDFLFLRPPGSTDPYHTVTQLLKEKTYFHDSQEDIRKILLSVNPGLFGNICCNQDDGLSCTFRFFLSSDNVNETDFELWIKQIFTHFNLEYCYKRHQKQIRSLQALLSQNDPQKTGLLLQIFVPQKYLDQIAYRAWPGGMPYHNQFETIPQNIMPSKELSDYTKPSFFANTPGHDLDAIQYRLLITNDVLLNPDSKTRIFRYYNRIPSIVEYEKEIKKLFNELARELAAAA